MHSDDSSDEEIRVRIGNVPVDWYDDLPFLGYDVKGNAVPKLPTEDALEKHLRKTEDPEYWKTITDELNAKKIKLTPEMLDLIHKIRTRKTASALIDPYSELHIPMKKEISGLHADVMPPKRRFVPSKWERIKVGRLARAIQKGWLKPKLPESENNWDLWADEGDDAELPKPPKASLPGHIESYNPPSEYLLTPEEQEKWLTQHPEDRETNFLPQKHSALRRVPGYENSIKEAFGRCMDLFLCPRIVRPKINVDPDSLIPQLPDPETLRPFPEEVKMIYKGHSSHITSLDFTPDGAWMLTGSSGGEVVIWESLTGKPVLRMDYGDRVYSVAWNPVRPIFAVALKKRVEVRVCELIGEMEFVQPEVPESEEEDEDGVKPEKVVYADWRWSEGTVEISMRRSPHYLTWHAKGDYFATLHKRENLSRQVLVHSFSRGQSAKLFSRKTKGGIRAIAFHPKRALFFAATQKQVLTYDLKQRMLVKKFKGLEAPNQVHIHHSGDHVIIPCEDCKLQWYDYDTGEIPYKTYKFHKRAIISVDSSRKYPLMATSSYDGDIHLFHAGVSSDMMSVPTVIPIKILKGTGGVPTIVKFYPRQPWLAAVVGREVLLYV